MNRIIRLITKPWFSFYSRLRKNDKIQTEDQTVNRLLSFYLSSIILAFLVAAIVAWIIPLLPKSQDGIKAILELILAAAAVKLSYDFIRDVIATEVSAAITKVKEEQGMKLLEDLETLRNQIDNSTIKQNLDNKYLAFLKQSLGAESLKLQAISPKLMNEYSMNRSVFEEQLDSKYRYERNFREARCVIHELPKGFLQVLAVKGISDALEIPLRDAIERTKSGRDLHSFRVDLYAYLSAWLVCSLDNDNDMLMPLEPIGISYREQASPDKEAYKTAITKIGETILNGEYKNFNYYPPSDPLQSIEVRKVIVERLNQIIGLIDNYQYERILRQ